MFGISLNKLMLPEVVPEHSEGVPGPRWVDG